MQAGGRAGRQKEEEGKRGENFNWKEDYYWISKEARKSLSFFLAGLVSAFPQMFFSLPHFVKYQVSLTVPYMKDAQFSKNTWLSLFFFCLNCVFIYISITWLGRIDLDKDGADKANITDVCTTNIRTFQFIGSIAEVNNDDSFRTQICVILYF